jgi:oligosaccharide repeat unit polymerase
MTAYATNPLFLFLGVWGTAGALYLGGVLAGTFPFPHPLTIGVLLLNIGTFSLGYLTWTLLGDLTPRGIGRSRADIKPLTPQRIRLALTFTLLMGLIAFLLMLYRVALIAAHSNTGFLDLLRHPHLLRFRVVQFIEIGASQISWMVMLISLTSALFAIGFVLLGVFLRIDVTARRYAYLLAFLLVTLATCLINLSRYDMTVSVLYLILAYGVTSSSFHGETRPHVVRDLLPPVAAVVTIFVVVELLRKSATYGPAGNWRSILFSFYWYLASPIAALNEFLAGFHGDYGLGEKTFTPFFKWLHRFHLAAPPTFSVYGEFVYIPYPANVYTYLRNFYEDFGILGVAIVPYAFGGLMAVVKERASRYFHFLNLYVFLLVPIVFSFYCFPLLSSQFYLQLLFGFIFFHRRLPVSVDPRRSAAPCAEQTA